MSGLFDYHVHTHFCPHASGRAEEYVLRAVELGLDEIGFAEHVPMYWLPKERRDATIAMDEAQMDEYVQTVLDLDSRFPEIHVRLGIEADYIPGAEDALARLLAPYPWDYVYGSVHFLGEWGFDNPAAAHRYDEWNLDELYETYFDTVAAAAESGLFDVIGHIDVIKKWGHRPPRPSHELFVRAADAVASAGVGVELNTAGYRKPVRELYPSAKLLTALVERGVDLTLGSDSHAPSEVGLALDAAVSEARAAGAVSLVRFQKRRRVTQSI